LEEKMDGSWNPVQNGVLDRIDRCSVLFLCACGVLLNPKEHKRMGCDDIVETIALTREGY